MTKLDLIGTRLAVDGTNSFGFGLMQSMYGDQLAQSFGSKGGVSWDEGHGHIISILDYLKSKGFNTIRALVGAYQFLPNNPNFPPSFGGHLHELAQLCNERGMALLCDVWCSEYDRPSSDQYPVPYSTMSIEDFNQALFNLGNLMKDMPNVGIGIWNEPILKSLSDYDTWFNTLPSMISAVRSSGFTNPVSVMGSMGYDPRESIDHDTRRFGWCDDNLQWALEHKNLFTDHGKVYADVHIYTDTQPDVFPSDMTELQALWIDSQYGIKACQNQGIPVTIHEIGSGVDLLQQQKCANAFATLNANKVSWNSYALDNAFLKPDPYDYTTMTTGWDAPFNAWGELVLAGHPPSTPINPLPTPTGLSPLILISAVMSLFMVGVLIGKKSET